MIWEKTRNPGNGVGNHHILPSCSTFMFNDNGDKCRESLSDLSSVILFQTNYFVKVQISRSDI